MEISIDWDVERVDAHALLRSLCEEFQETEAAHSGLLKRWPERPDQVSVVSSYSASCVPEVDLRQAEHNPFVFLRKLIHESVNTLLRAPPCGRGVDPDPSDHSHVKTMMCLAKLSDRGVVEAVPYLLPKLQRKALLWIHSFLSDGKKIDSRNRFHLLKTVEQGLLQGSFLAELLGGRRRTQNGTKTPTQKVLEILRSPCSYKSEAELSKGCVSLLGSRRSPITAAIEALMQLDSLPLTSLHVMLEALRGRIPDAKIGKLPAGSNKNRLSNSIMGIGTALLSDAKNEDPLPETLRKALVVMSLSARHSSGDDGKLIEHLGPHSRKIRTRQRRILFCLSRLKLLSKDNVAALLADLAKSPDVLPIAQPKPGSLRTILLDCLLRSENRPIPKAVRGTLTAIKKIVRRHPESKSKEKTPRREILKFGREEDSSEFREVRTGIELEATLRVSAHLQQMVRDSLPESRGWNEAKARWKNSSRKGVLRSDMEEKIISACDRTAGVGYSLVGCALEGMIRYTSMSQNSKYSVAEYLRSGRETYPKRKSSDLASHSPPAAQDQVTFILNSAESFLGASVLSRVRIRLGKI